MNGLVFLDGTWSQARTLRDSWPALRSLPCYRLAPKVPSRYRIRAEPRSGYVSTIEAVAEALSIVEPNLEGLEELIRSFQDMIAQQVSYAGRNQPRHRRRRHRQPSRAVPQVLLQAQRIVVGYGEFLGSELMYWAATDLETQACFESYVRPNLIPGTDRLTHAGLTAEAVHAGVDLPTFKRRWAVFANGAVLVSWNQSTIAKFPGPEPKVALKRAYCNVKRTSGSIFEVVVREGLTPANTQFMGRAKHMMDHLLPVTEMMLNSAARCAS